MDRYGGDYDVILVDWHNLAWFLQVKYCAFVHLDPGQTLTLSLEISDLIRCLISTKRDFLPDLKLGRLLLRLGRQKLHRCRRVRRALSCRSYSTVREKWYMNSLVQSLNFRPISAFYPNYDTVFRMRFLSKDIYQYNRYRIK